MVTVNPVSIQTLIHQKPKHLHTGHHIRLINNVLYLYLESRLANLFLDILSQAELPLYIVVTIYRRIDKCQNRIDSGQDKVSKKRTTLLLPICSKAHIYQVSSFCEMLPYIFFIQTTICTKGVYWNPKIKKMSKTPRITLRLYFVKIRKEKEVENFLPISRFGQNHDLIDFLHNEIANWRTTDETKIVKDEAQSKILRRHSRNFSLGTRSVFGLLESGEYGHEAALVNADTGQDSYKKKLKDAEMIPFYFHLHIPSDGTVGLLVLQTYKQFGVQGIFTSAISKAFRQKHPEFIIEFNPLFSKELVDKFLNEGSISKISFRDTDVNSKFSDFIPNVKIPREFFDIEINVIAKRRRKGPKRFADAISGLIKGHHKLNQLVELKNFETSETKVVANLNGRQRTVDIDKLDSIGSFFDVTNEMGWNNNTMQPTFDSVHAAAKTILDDTIDSLGISV